MIQRFKPDLVITDIRMPKMDGLEMTRDLFEKKNPAHVVILSGYSEFDYAQKAIQYGVDDYLLKPLLWMMCRGCCRRLKKELKRNS